MISREEGDLQTDFLLCPYVKSIPKYKQQKLLSELLPWVWLGPWTPATITTTALWDLSPLLEGTDSLCSPWCMLAPQNHTALETSPHLHNDWLFLCVNVEISESHDRGERWDLCSSCWAKHEPKGHLLWALFGGIMAFPFRT